MTTFDRIDPVSLGRRSIDWNAVLLGGMLALLLSANAVLVLFYGLIGVPGNSLITGGFLVASEIIILLLSFRRHIVLLPADYLFGAFLVCIALSFARNGPTAHLREWELLAVSLFAYPVCRLFPIAKFRTGFVWISAAIVVVGAIITAMALASQWYDVRTKPLVLGHDGAAIYVLGEGFSARVMDAFLTVLSEDTRFRNLPVVMTSDTLAPGYDLPNLEIMVGDPARLAANALPLIRQHAFEAHLARTLRSIDADGLLDPQTGLLTAAAFNRDFAGVVQQTLSGGGGLSVARFAFDPAQQRALLDGARILSRLMRQMDFGAAQQDGSVIVVFPETDLRTAHMIARRLSSVMRHTTHGKRDTGTEPAVTSATLLPSDTAESLLARLYAEARRAAS